MISARPDRNLRYYSSSATNRCIIVSTLDRRQFLESAAILGVSGTLFPGVLYARAVQDGELTIETIAKAEEIAGLTFTDEQRELMLNNLNRNLSSYSALHEVHLPNSVVPSQMFDPELGKKRVPRLDTRPEIEWIPGDIPTRSTHDDLAFSSVAELASLLKARRLRSVDLTELYISRLRKFDILEAVVSITEDRAYRMARRADEELDAGIWRGPLHGIPWGAKDLLSVAGYPTSWGAEPYKDQRFDRDAAVVRRLDEAGAVLVAKLTLGALAMGDVWYGGKTRNPWNAEVGSSGSSAGPGAAVAAGLVGFAIGSETLGSIVSPSNRNGVTGFRPTFGRVSRAGAMTLSWTMDKLGPMCRNAQDCALVFSAIHGSDPDDPTTLTAPFEWPVTRSLKNIRIGYLKEAFEEDYENKAADEAALDILRRQGAELTPIALPDGPVGAMLVMLNAEAAAAFDELTRTGGTDSMVRQGRGAWPNSFRSSRFIPAVEYINASRVRTLLMQDMATVLKNIDVFASPTFGGGTLRITNLTGHPSVTVPNRFEPLEGQPSSRRRTPSSITFVGGLYRDAEALAVAHAFQSATEFHLMRPPIE